MKPNIVPWHVNCEMCDSERAESGNGRKVHVIPLDDLIEHSDDDDCLCGPTPEFVEGGVVYVHHSLDGRELSE